MRNKFGQIHDFQYRQAKKMENSLYLEELTGLLAKVASGIDDEKYYFFGGDYYLKGHEKEPNSDFKNFIESFKNTFSNGSGGEINIIRGRAGVGKSLFFQKGVQHLIDNKNVHYNSYIHMGVDFKNIDNDKEVSYYVQWIYDELCKNAIDCIRMLGEERYYVFNDKYIKFGNTYKTPHTFLFPLKFFCEEIFKLYNRPCIVVFDNIDLASVKTQKNVFDAVVIVCSEFSKFMRRGKFSNCYRIYFVMRPETKMCYNEGRLGTVINFPLPNILKISLAILEKVLIETAKEFDNRRELSCYVTCQNVITDDGEIKFKTFTQVAKYLYQILEHYLNKIWNDNPQIVERLGTSEEFHCNIANYNVRIFLKFLSDTISNGGFKPFTDDFNRRHGVRYYNVYDYIEMIIRGRWYVHPGNRHINGEGGNKAPIVFNVFETNLYGKTQKDKIKHFMLNIRILQYCFLYANDFEITYGEMRSYLSNFFNENHILNATKKLAHVRFLYSYVQGENIIATIPNWQDVIIEDTTKLQLSPVGKFYLERLICEFEYIYQMALSSLMCQTYVDELSGCWKTEKEKTVLCFLKSIYEILKENIEDYKKSDSLIEFKKLFFCEDNQCAIKPFRRMLDRFIFVMKNKVQRAERLDTNSISKLERIFKEAKELKEEAEEYFDLI